MNLYNRQKAVDYAHTWKNRRNSQFYDFENLGGDCTNFISQCLLYGVLEMRAVFYFTMIFPDGKDIRFMNNIANAMKFCFAK